jgi:hypothetical protein
MKANQSHKLTDRCMSSVCNVVHDETAHQGKFLLHMSKKIIIWD